MRNGLPRDRDSGGFTLIELTVAMGLSLLVLAIVVDLFDQLSYLGESTAAIADTNQTARASVNMLTRDLKAAGAGIPTGGISLPFGDGSPLFPTIAINKPGPGTQLFPGTGVAVPGPDPLNPNAAPVLSAVTPGNNGALPSNQPNDEVTLIVVDPNSTLSQAPLVSVSASQIQFAAGTDLSTGGTQVNPGDLIMLTTASGAVLGYVTQVDNTAKTVTFADGDLPMHLNHAVAKGGNIASLGIACTPGCNPSPTAWKIRMITYYLDSTVSPPKFMKQAGSATPTLVATNVTGLQLLYNLSDGTVNQSNPPGRNLIRRADFAVTAQSSRPLRKSHAVFSNTIASSVMFRNLTYKSKY